MLVALAQYICTEALPCTPCTWPRVLGSGAEPRKKILAPKRHLHAKDTCPTDVQRRRRHRRRRRRHRPLVLAPTPCSPCSSTFTCSSRRSFSFRKMHTDMGDERGIRLRCICLGDAALRGSRMSARGRCGKGAETWIARSSLSNARSSVCATTRCLRINITIHQCVRYDSVFAY